MYCKCAICRAQKVRNSELNKNTFVLLLFFLAKICEISQAIIKNGSEIHLNKFYNLNIDKSIFDQNFTFFHMKN